MADSNNDDLQDPGIDPTTGNGGALSYPPDLFDVVRDESCQGAIVSMGDKLGGEGSGVVGHRAVMAVWNAREFRYNFGRGSKERSVMISVGVALD
jgi:hypothetical protein